MLLRPPEWKNSPKVVVFSWLIALLMLSQNVANAYAIKMNAPLVTMFNSAGVHPPLRSQGLCSSMLETAKTQKHLTLWSMYPASVRGRVFDGIGGDPVMSFGGGW